MALGANHGVGYLPILKGGTVWDEARWDEAAWSDSGWDSSKIAGSCFLISPYLAVTCAHVVAAHLSLGDDVPNEAPEQNIVLKFPIGKRKARIASEGWEPDLDVAVLELDEPIGQDIEPTPLCAIQLTGERRCRVVGYKPGHLDKAQSNPKVEIDFVATADDLYQLNAPGELSGTFRIDHGFSGGPVFDVEGTLVFGMTTSKAEERKRPDGVHVAYAVPAIDMLQVKRAVEVEREGLAKSIRRYRDEKAEALVPEVNTDNAVEQDDLLGLIGELKIEAHSQQNRLPENFRFTAIEIGLELLERILRRAGQAKEGKGVKTLGTQAVFLLDLAAALDAMAREGMPELTKLEPLIRDLIAKLGGTEALPALEFEPAAWDFELRSALRVTLGAIEVELKELELEHDPDLMPVLEEATDAHLQLRQQVERERPDWPVLGAAGRDLKGALVEADSSMFGGLPSLARQAASGVRAAAERMIAGLDDLKSFQDLPETPVMVILPAGSFMMGSPEDENGRYDDEGPQHQVTFARRTAIGRYPVTFEEYQVSCRARQIDLPSDEGWGRGLRPAINVSWKDAKAYLAWLSERTGAPYDLPSEAFWEYACRTNTAKRYAFGDEIRSDQANFERNERSTTPVKAYPANGFGLHDMHGNVYEWVEDSWHDRYRRAPDDGSAWVEGKNSPLRVIRGGAWNSYPRNLRSANRSRDEPGFRSDNVGFRVSRTLIS